MPTTPDTVTDAQIAALRDEAAAAGDRLQVTLCDIALGDRPGHTISALEARGQCARVIAHTEAQQ